MTAKSTSPPRVWIDIDNPPQVQYLAPLAEAFERRGSAVLITARDHGIAHELLRERSLPFEAVGSHPGASNVAKTVAVLRRALALAGRGRSWHPDVAVFATRSAALAAPLLRIPGFALMDYEFIDLRAFRLARSYVVLPSLLEDALLARGFSPARLVPYEGIKEDITFSGIDLDEIEPYAFPQLDGSRVPRVLVRPPDDRSHYFREASRALTRSALERLARQEVTVVVSPRYPEQADLVSGIAWRIDPLVLHEAVPFVQLLKGVDAIVTGGGTMAREAAYMGIPSFTVFSGELGAVDRYLESLGRLVVLRDVSSLDELRIEPHRRAPVLASNPGAVEEIVAAISKIVAR